MQADSAPRRRPRRRRSRLRAPGRAPPQRAPRPLLPDARLAARRRGRAPGGAAAGLARASTASRAAARCAPGSTGSPPTPASTCSAPPQARCCRSSTRRPPTRTSRPGEPVAEQVWLEPYPGRDARDRGRLRLPGRQLRAARGGRARLRRRDAAPAAAPARGADPARGARLLRQGGRRDARHLGRPRSTAPCSAPARRSRRALPERSQQVTLRSLGDARLREIVEDYMEAMRERRRQPRRLDADRGRRLVDAAAGQLVPRRRDRGLPRATGRSPATGGGATARPAPTASSRSAPTPGSRPSAPTSPSRSTSSPCDGDRIKDVTAFVVRPADTDGWLFSVARVRRRPASASSPSSERFGLPDHVD